MRIRRSVRNDFGRLFQGVRNCIKTPTNTCHFIRKEQVPKDRFKGVTCGKFEYIERPQKTKSITGPDYVVMGGNRINSPGEVKTR